MGCIPSAPNILFLPLIKDVFSEVFLEFAYSNYDEEILGNYDAQSGDFHNLAATTDEQSVPFILGKALGTMVKAANEVKTNP